MLSNTVNIIQNHFLFINRESMPVLSVLAWKSCALVVVCRNVCAFFLMCSTNRKLYHS